jgi:hypothetical protein
MKLIKMYKKRIKNKKEKTFPVCTHLTLGGGRQSINTPGGTEYVR